MNGSAKIAIICGVLVLGGCRTERTAADAVQKQSIVTTTGMIRDAVVNLVDTLAEVNALMGPGVDPHLYQATPGDLAKLNRADVIVYNGLFLEGKLDDILGKLSRTRTVINFSDGADPEQLLDVVDAVYEEEIYDPHIWFDIDIWKDCISALADRLIEQYPEWEVPITANLDAYLGTLTRLKSDLIATMAEVPEADRILVTSHDAFRYFGRMLDIRVEALQGVSTVSDFGLQDRRNLVELIVREGVPAIFIESTVGDKPIRAILDDCRDLGHEVVLGGTLYSDAMGREGSAEGTYTGMLRHNVATVRKGLLQEAATVDTE